MTEPKTKETDAGVGDFIDAIEDETKRADCRILLQLYRDVTGQPPKMWGPSIIGFDKYHYKSERSRQEGDWPMVGFSPRKANLTLYFMLGFADLDELLGKLGRHKTSVGCLYINKLADVDIDVLRQLIERGYAAMRERYPG